MIAPGDASSLDCLAAGPALLTILAALITASAAWAASLRAHPERS